MNRRATERAANPYSCPRYMSLVRMVSHWQQANEIARVLPRGGDVLEVGVGSGHTSWLLSKWGYDVTTVDLDPCLEPTVVGDVTLLPFGAGCFDLVLAAQILEHIPFADFPRAVSELRRVARKYVIITVPAPLVGISLLVNVPGPEPVGFHLGFPYWLTHRSRGEHYWELGKRGYSKRRVRQAISGQGLKIVRELRPPLSLFSYFFVAHVV